MSAAQNETAYPNPEVLGDIDTWFKRAVDAGATGVMEVQDMFWGARYGQGKDPFGVLWSMNEPK